MSQCFLCDYCYYDGWQYSCYQCVDNAQYWSISSCTCMNGYYQSDNSCLPVASESPWKFIGTGIGVIVVFVALVICCRKMKKRRNENRYNMLEEPVATAGAVGVGLGVAALVANQSPRIRVTPSTNPTVPVNPPRPAINPTNPVGANPYNTDAYVPPPFNANPYNTSSPYTASPYNTSPVVNSPAEQVCSICMRGNCDCRTSCGHASHQVCLDGWRLPTCPTCRRFIPELNRN